MHGFSASLASIKLLPAPISRWWQRCATEMNGQTPTAASSADLHLWQLGFKAFRSASFAPEIDILTECIWLYSQGGILDRQQWGSQRTDTILITRHSISQMSAYWTLQPILQYIELWDSYSVSLQGDNAENWVVKLPEFPCKDAVLFIRWPRMAGDSCWEKVLLTIISDSNDNSAK